MDNTEWTIEQTKALFDRCHLARKKGESLSKAFRDIAATTSRSVNSVRNYYYAQAKTFEMVPDMAKKLGIKLERGGRDRFVPFTDTEVDALIKNVLIAKGRGISVRKAINELAGGNAKEALRLQNKYRSCLRSHRDKVEAIVRELEHNYQPCFNPYGNSYDNFTRLTEYIAALDDTKVGKFLNLIEKLT